jgi:hypothetical protein
VGQEERLTYDFYYEKSVPTMEKVSRPWGKVYNDGLSVENGKKCPKDEEKFLEHGEKCPKDGEKCPDHGEKCTRMGKVSKMGEKCPEHGEKCPIYGKTTRAQLLGARTSTAPTALCSLRA